MWFQATTHLHDTVEDTENIVVAILDAFNAPHCAPLLAHCVCRY